MTEDLTTYNEVDPSSNITVTVLRSSFVLLPRNLSAYVYKGFTIGGVGDYRIEANIKATGHVSQGIAVVLGVSNEISSYDGWLSGQRVRLWHSGEEYRIVYDDVAGDTAFFSISENIDYYLVLERVGRTGILTIYDSARILKLAILRIPVSGIQFRYLYVTSSDDTEDTGTMTGLVEDVSIVTTSSSSSSSSSSSESSSSSSSSLSSSSSSSTSSSSTSLSSSSTSPSSISSSSSSSSLSSSISSSLSSSSTSSSSTSSSSASGPEEEDLLTYQEFDPNNRILIDIENNASQFSNLSKGERAGLFKNFGAGFFGDYSVKSKIRAFGQSGQGVGGVLAFSNVIDEYGVWEDGHRVALMYDGTAFRISISDKNGNSDSYIISIDTDYWVTLARAGTIVTLQIYSDSARAILLATKVITVSDTTFQYFYATVSENTNELLKTISGVSSEIIFE